MWGLCPAILTIQQLQNAFYEHISSKGFELERGLPVEETGAKHEKIEDLKKLTNYENTKKILKEKQKELEWDLER